MPLSYSTDTCKSPLRSDASLALTRRCAAGLVGGLTGGRPDWGALCLMGGVGTDVALATGGGGVAVAAGGVGTRVVGTGVAVATGVGGVVAGGGGADVGVAIRIVALGIEIATVVAVGSLGVPVVAVVA